MNKLLMPNTFILVLLASLALQGCAAVVVGAGAGAIKVSHDRRTLGTQIDDATLSGKVASALAADEELTNSSNINVETFNGVVLLVGQTPTEGLKQQAHKLADQIKPMRKLHNLIRIGQPVAVSTATNDVWLASKVRAQLIADKRIDGLHINVTVEDSEVFLMGLVTNQEANTAVEIARNINGVARVVKAFEVM